MLRYWEEELRLPIKRNELGHRYYTQEDVERFRQIKAMKERGLQLKAIKMILKDGKLDVLPQEDFTEGSAAGETHNTMSNTEGDQAMAIEVVSVRDANCMEEGEEVSNVIRQGTPEPVRQHTSELSAENREDKARRLQWLLQQLIRETLRENNEELCQSMKESIIKELDYQLRNQERDRQAIARSEEYYRKMDELLCKKSRRRSEKREKKAEAALQQPTGSSKPAAGKKKRHFVF